ncbi:hypothetical protein ACWCQ1_42200 [Streptomyces sp. NPDC002144]
MSRSASLAEPAGLVVPDIHVATSGWMLAAPIHDPAPGVRLRFQLATPHIVHRAQEHLRTVDGMPLAQGLLANFPAIDLYEDRWVCVVSSDTVESAPPILEALAAGPWVLPYHCPSMGFSPLHIAIEKLLTMPYLNVGTDGVGMVPERAGQSTQHQASTTVSILSIPVIGDPLFPKGLASHENWTRDGHAIEVRRFVRVAPLTGAARPPAACRD